MTELIMNGGILMYKLEKENQAIEKYGELRLNYNVSSEPYYKKQNDNNYEALREALYNVGIYLSIEERKEQKIDVMVVTKHIISLT